MTLPVEKSQRGAEREREGQFKCIFKALFTSLVLMGNAQTSTDHHVKKQTGARDNWKCPVA
jgi:hypothetical protein